MQGISNDEMIMLLKAYESYMKIKETFEELTHLDMYVEGNVFDELDKLEELIYAASSPKLTEHQNDNYVSMAGLILRSDYDTSEKARLLLGIELDS